MTSFTSLFVRLEILIFLGLLEGWGSSDMRVVGPHGLFTWKPNYKSIELLIRQSEFGLRNVRVDIRLFLNILTNRLHSLDLWPTHFLDVPNIDVGIKFLMVSLVCNVRILSFCTSRSNQIHDFRWLRIFFFRSIYVRSQNNSIIIRFVDSIDLSSTFECLWLFIEVSALLLSPFWSILILVMFSTITSVSLRLTHMNMLHFLIIRLWNLGKSWNPFFKWFSQIY